jgi:hypothetical protein
MKKITLCLLALLPVTFSLVAQNRNPSRVAAHRTLEEKLRGYDVPAAYQWMVEHPGEQLPGHLWTMIDTDATTSRDADQLVSGNAQAESEVHAAINPIDSNNIIVAAIVQDAANALSPLNVPVHYTKNFGQTWQNAAVQFNPIPGALPAGGGDPVIAFDKSGKAYLSWLVLTLNLLSTPPVKLTLYNSTSTNGGQSWGTPVKIDEGAISLEVLLGEAGTGTLVDKQWMATDQSTTAHEGNLYVSYTKIDIIDSLTANTNIFLKRKPKSSNTFSANPVQLNTNTYGIIQFSSIAVDQEGGIHVSFFAGNSTFDMGVYHTLSTDGGLTFSVEKKIAPAYFPGYLNTAVTPDTISGISSDRLYPCPHIATGKTPGYIYAVWTANGKTTQLTAGYDIWFSKSNNNGLTWSAATTINPGTDETAEQFYPSIAVTSDGVVCVSYYDRTGDPNGSSTNYVVACSFDEGDSFQSAITASTTPSDFGAIGELNGGFGIGEYTQVVCAPHTAIPVWSDGRTNDGNIEIYAAFLPVNNGSVTTHEWGVVSSLFDVVAPTPSKGNVVVNIDLKKASKVSIQIFANNGKLIACETGTNPQNEGSHNFRFDLKPGVYFCNITTDFGVKIKKVVVE